MRLMRQKLGWWHKFSTKKPERLSRNTPAIIALLIIFFPIGLYLMWRRAKWPLASKIVISSLFALPIILLPIAAYYSGASIDVDHSLNNRIATDNANYTITGDVSSVHTASLTIDGKSVPLNGGKFSYKTNLKQGDNTFVFVAKDSKGTDKEVITVHRTTAAEFAARAAAKRAAEAKAIAAKKKAEGKTTSKTTTSKQKTSTPTTTSKPSAPSRSTLNSEATVDLTSATNFYANLFQQAQTALGTYQYPDAASAMSDGTWMQFSAKVSSTDNSQAEVIQPYNKASNQYTDNNQIVPDAIGNWQYDMQTVDSDYQTWVQQGTSWLDSEITTAQLNTYTQTFQNDLTSARNDVKQIQ